MPSSDSTQCPHCGAAYEDFDPFCLECGELLPSVIFPGDLSVEMSDVPSENHRARLVDLLKSWFPRFDSVDAEQRIKKKTILVDGVDEESGKRLVKALEKLKVGARITRGVGLSGLLLNGGLVISALALVLLVVLLPFGMMLTELLLFLIMVAAPAVGAWRKREQMKPLVWTPTALTRDEHWPRPARAYAGIKEKLGREEGELIKEIFRGVFELFSKLSRGSLAAMAAGKERGELAYRLEETMDTALEIARKWVADDGGRRPDLKQELVTVRDLVGKTADWFRTVEDDKVRAVPAIGEDLQEIRESIDRIVGEVRAVEQPAVTRREKVPE